MSACYEMFLNTYPNWDDLFYATRQVSQKYYSMDKLAENQKTAIKSETERNTM